jgi:cyclic pyranopterin phosphate synthase
MQPLVRKDLVELARSLRGLGLKELAITTNGVAPRSKLIDLVDAGVTHFNVSLDTLLPDRFAAISRRPAKMLSTVLGTIDQLFESG